MSDIIKELNKALRQSRAYMRTMDTPSEESTPEYEDGYQAGINLALREIEKAKTSTAAIIKRAIRAHIRANYGQSEAQKPSWDIPSLADAIAAAINK